MTSKFIFDTYALFAIIQGNENYKPYLDSNVVINNFIFAEFCYNLYKEEEPLLRGYIDKYSKFISSVNPEWIEEAMKFRLAWKNRNVSITDCIGYIMAKRTGIPFLTGDKEFKSLEGVEFVK
ncbi:PIN domain-containing protein [Candidatus Pacearchaeota archaeon]|nr:PIN domain-containing protein [Candidatus Pacearchaeota archaeon]